MINWISRALWHGLQAPPPRHWGRDRRTNPRTEQTSLILAFTLSGLALISGVILSALVVYQATDRIARARENSTFDLLAVTPGGGFGASWAIFASFLHYDLTLRTLNRMRLNTLRAVLVVGVVTLLPVFIPALERGDSFTQNEAWSWLLFYIFLLPMMYFDHLYAVVSGGLISVLIPAYLRADSRAAALFAGVTLHLTGYLIAVISGAVMLPAVYEALGIFGWLADVTRPLAALVVFVLIHEAAALLLYRAAQTRLNDTDEIIPISVQLYP